MTRPFVRLGVVAAVATVVALLLAGPFVPAAPLDGVLADADGGDGPWFEDVARDSGANYTFHTAGGRVIGNDGVYVADYDRDGWTDLLVLGGDRPVLFENRGGTFAPSGALPAAAGRDARIQSALFFDYDGDGWEDLLFVPETGTPRLLENEGGTFVVREGVFPPSLSLSVGSGATAADYDGDGCLDLLVIQNGDWRERQPAGFNSLDVGTDNGNPNLLLDGDCESFANVTAGAGLRGARWSLAASFVDFTGDGRPDVHVANDFNRDVLYVNRGNGTFARRELGDATDRNGMSSEVADVNGDGRFDVFVTNIYGYREMPKRGAGNNLLINDGEGFSAAAPAYGVDRGGWGWAAVLADFDNDADLDLLHATQASMSMQSLSTARPEDTLPAFWTRNGSRFVAANASRAGLRPTDGRGLAALDFDRDGDLDVAATAVDGTLRLYRNDRSRGHWLQVRLADEGGPVLGARVDVTTADGETHHRVVNARSDFRSQDSRLVHVGLGSVGDVARVRVRWPDGTETVVEDVAVDRRLVVGPSGVERESQ